MDDRLCCRSCRPTRRPGARWRWVAAAVLVLASAGGCSVERALPIPHCDGGTVILAAQSVPTAEQVPCFDSLPDGWNVDTTVIGDQGTIIRFDSDRAGSGAAVFHFVERCDTSDALPVQSMYPGALQYESVERVAPAFVGRRFHLFTGTCMWWQFDFDEGAGSALSIELGEHLRTVGRDELDEAIRSSFVDEDL